MCFCDGYSFLVINKDTEEKHFIEGDENLVEFFKGYYSLPCLFHRLLKKNMYVLRIPFTTYPTTPTPIVNVSKCTLLKG